MQAHKQFFTYHYQWPNIQFRIYCEYCEAKIDYLKQELIQFKTKETKKKQGLIQKI